MLLIKAYVTGQTIKLEHIKTVKGDTTNDKLVEHKDKSPSMVDEVAKLANREKQQKAQIVGSSDKSGKSDRTQAAYPKIIAQKERKQEAKKSRCRRDKKIRSTIEEGHQNPRTQWSTIAD